MLSKLLSRSLLLAGTTTIAASGLAMVASGTPSPVSAAPGSVSAPVLPCPWPDSVCGRPIGLDAGDQNGWYFWSDADGLHLRTTTPADRAHPFTAVLTTDGRFADIDKVRLEHADDITVTEGGHRLIVRLWTFDGMDGVDFKIHGGDRLRLRLEEFGVPVPEGRIITGFAGSHPESNPFTIRRAP